MLIWKSLYSKLDKIFACCFCLLVGKGRSSRTGCVVQAVMTEEHGALVDGS